MSVKKIRLYFRGKRIEDQYSLDLQYNLTPQDFHLILALFNEATHLNPPPGPTVLWLITLFLLWITFGALAYLLWIKFSSFYIFITIPIFLIASTLAMSMLRKNKKLRFEASILQICSQLNATENIRGINFSFIKDTKDLALDSTRSTTRTKSVYVIDIEIDNRYAALRSHQFNLRSPSEDDVHQLASPKLACVKHHSVDEKNHSYDMFHEPPPAWSPPYSEKIIYSLA